jgi:tetratricopeptide (TPR) repeat protein
LVEQIASEAGIENPEELLHEAVHHDHDDDATLSEEELKSAAEVVVAQHEVTREPETEIIEGESHPSSEVTPTGPAVESSAPPAESEAMAPVLDIDALTEEATELLKAGESKQALALLKPHLKTVAAQHAGAWRIAGGAMARLELDNHAIAAMTHAQNLEPGHAPGWFNLGSVQQRNGHIHEAMTAYGRAVDADASYAKAAEKMVTVAKENGLIEPYMNSVRRLLAIEPDHEERHELVKMLLQLAQGESDVLDQGTGLPPTLPAGPEMAAEALTLMEDRASPERALALSLSLQHSDAVLMWKSLIQQDQQSPENWVGLARALEQAGDLETAAKCHAKAAALGGGGHESLVTPPIEPETPEPEISMSSQPTADHLQAANEFGYEEVEMSVEMETVMPEHSEEAFAQVGQEAANDLLLTPIHAVQKPAEHEVRPEVDLAKAALDAAQAVAVNNPQNTASKAIANQEVAWFNQGIQLIEDKKYREALSCFDKALPAFAGDDAMIIRILNNRGNAFYLLEEYPKCVEAYHQAMLIRPTEVRGDTLYNMGTAYSMMGRYMDAIKCFEQAIPRGLSDEAVRSAKDQIRRCNILQKAVDKKKKRK